MMTYIEPWTREYMEEMFSRPDPWRYFTTPYEQRKYLRQIEAIKDRNSAPGKILEIGSAEGAHTLLLVQHFPFAAITGVEISSHAVQRARESLHSFAERVELVNADIVDYESQIEDASCDICIWSESVYYLGARLSLIQINNLLSRIVGKLRGGGLLVMVNSVDLPEAIPESAVTKKPLIDSYYNLLSNLAVPVLRAAYTEEKLGRNYEYHLWVFQR
jgi:trans-aconitate methyltransferase